MKDKNIITLGIIPRVIFVLNDDIETLSTSFQDGCSTIFAGCTTYGSTPASNSPTDIVSAISNINTSGYNSGINAVKNSPNGYGLYTSEQYTANYTSGRTQGQNDVKGNPNGYSLYTASQYSANYTAGYNAGVAAGGSGKYLVRSGTVQFYGSTSVATGLSRVIGVSGNGVDTATGNSCGFTFGISGGTISISANNGGKYTRCTWLAYGS